jgi:hypothetical protein
MLSQVKNLVNVFRQRLDDLRHQFLLHNLNLSNIYYSLHKNFQNSTLNVNVHSVSRDLTFYFFVLVFFAKILDRKFLRKNGQESCATLPLCAGWTAHSCRG